MYIFRGADEANNTSYNPKYQVWYIDKCHSKWTQIPKKCLILNGLTLEVDRKLDEYVYVVQCTYNICTYN